MAAFNVQLKFRCQRHVQLAAVRSGLLLVEGAILALSRWPVPVDGSCGPVPPGPLRHLPPAWLARWSKAVFGTLFVAGELFVFGQWLISR